MHFFIVVFTALLGAVLFNYIRDKKEQRQLAAATEPETNEKENKMEEKKESYATRDLFLETLTKIGCQ